MARAGRVVLNALNPRGERLLRILSPVFEGSADMRVAERDARTLALEIAGSDRVFAEEERSRQPSAFTSVRRLIDEFAGAEVPFLGLHGAFGYDLLFQFEHLQQRMVRPGGAREMHLFLPDCVHVLDRRLERYQRLDFAFARDGVSTAGAATAPFFPIGHAEGASVRPGRGGGRGRNGP